MAHCRDVLHRHETKHIDAVRSFDRVKIQLQEYQTQKLNLATIQSLALIEPSLRNYEKLIVFLADDIIDAVDASSLWGFISLLLKVSKTLNIS